MLAVTDRETCDCGTPFIAQSMVLGLDPGLNLKSITYQVLALTVLEEYLAPKPSPSVIM